MYENINILIVDDTTFMRQNLIKHLVEHGFDESLIQEAENGKDAIEALAKDSSYDLIISDLNMPIMNGLEFLKKIRESSKERISNFKFILLTTDSEKDKIIEAVKLKVNSYVLKNSLTEKIIPEITRILELKGN